MCLDEIDAFLALQSNPTRVSSFGCLIGYLDPKAFIPDAEDFSTFMYDVFELNQRSDTINELEVKAPGYNTATSVFLIKKEKTLYEVVRNLGYKPMGFSKGDEFYAQTSVVLKPHILKTMPLLNSDDAERVMLTKILIGASRNALRREAFIHIGTSVGWDFEYSIDELGGLKSAGESGIVFAGRTVNCRNPWPQGGGS